MAKKKTKEVTWWDADIQHMDDRQKIDAVWPEHDRTSCNDEDLYNAGSIALRHRCERCEALSQLKFQELREAAHNIKG